MTETLPETTPIAQPQGQPSSPYRQRHRTLIGGVIALVAVVAVSFYLGRWSRNQSTGPAGPPQPLSSGQPSPTPPTPPKKPSGDPSDQPATKTAKTAEQAQQHLHQGNDHLNAGRYREALQEYEQVRRLDKSNQDVYYLMGLAHEKLGELELALQAHQQCTSGTYAEQAKRNATRLEKKLRPSK
jgi:tetratricopeptide (TPR) repeat protein